MEIEVRYVDALLLKLSEKTGKTLDHYNCGVISEKLEKAGFNISKKYLYETLYKGVEKVRTSGKNFMSLNPAKLNELLSYLDFRDVQAFIRAIDTPLNKQLETFAGTYYSYVRRNLVQDNGSIFKSPSKIFIADGNVMMTLKGGRLTYTGTVEIKSGCLFIHLRSDQDKNFYHIYRIGVSENPLVLQGTFAGVSNVFDPIAGRCVLVKTNEAFESLENKEVSIGELQKSSNLIDRRLGEYFGKYEKNNLSIEKVYAFDVNDLGQCE